MPSPDWRAASTARYGDAESIVHATLFAMAGTARGKPSHADPHRVICWEVQGQADADLLR